MLDKLDSQWGKIKFSAKSHDRFHDQIVLRCSINGNAMDGKTVASILSYFDLQSIGQRDRIEDCLDVVVAVRSLGYNLQAEVDFCIGKNDHGSTI